MFSNKFIETSGASAWTFASGTVIDLHSKFNDNKNLTLKLDISTSNASGQLDAYLSGAEGPDGNFGTFTMGHTGTSLVISAGTSITGSGALNGIYLIPLSMSSGSGLTVPLKGIPYIKLNTRATGASQAVAYDAWLIVG